MILRAYLAVAVVAFCLTLLGLRKDIVDPGTLLFAVVIAANYAMMWPVTVVILVTLNRIRSRKETP